jgi:hypothetical protein
MDILAFRPYVEATAMGLGVGLERYWSNRGREQQAAGSRTFAVLALSTSRTDSKPQPSRRTRRELSGEEHLRLLRNYSLRDGQIRCLAPGEQGR